MTRMVKKNLIEALRRGKKGTRKESIENNLDRREARCRIREKKHLGNVSRSVEKMLGHA